MRVMRFFIRLFCWFSLRHMRQHRWRALTVLLGIALGAAVFTSVRLCIHASLDSFTQSMNRIAGKADLSIVQPGSRVPERLIRPLLNHPLVQHASPVLSAYVKLPGADSRPFLLIGIDPILDRPFREWNVSQTRDDENRWLDLIRYPFTLLTAGHLAAENGWKPDDAVTLEHTRQPSEFRILGILSTDGLALVEGGRVAITDIATFQEFTGLYGELDRIDLIFKPGISRQQQKQIRRLLPSGIIPVSPSERRESGRMMIRAYQLNLSVLSFVSLFVGMFLVYSVVALNAASRRKEIAVLRSLGTSPGMIFFLFLADGFVFGLFGWLLAIPVSTFLVKYLLQGISLTISTLFVRVQIDQLSISGWEMVLSFSVTLIVSILASWHPAGEAMRVSPKEAFGMTVTDNGRFRKKLKLAIIGAVLVVLVWPISRIPARPGFAVYGYVATFWLFAGFSLMAPFLLQQVGKLTAPVSRRLAGEPAYLAARYLKNAGTRTAVSVGALITAVALYTALVIMIHSFRNTVELWVNQTISGDLFVTARLSETNRYRDPLPDEMVMKLKNIDVAADLFPFRRIYLSYNRIPYQLEAMDFEIFRRYGKFFWIRGDPQKEFSKLIQGEGCLVSEVFAQRTGFQTGDRFRCQIGKRHLTLPILGIVRDYRTHGGVVFYDLKHFSEHMGKTEWSGVRFFFHDRDQNLNQAVTALQNIIFERIGSNLSMIRGVDLRQQILNIFDETFAVTSVLLIIALIVATLGIATTLTIQVLERSRQINTIFAIGGSKPQICAMIFFEAVLMVTAGEIAGLACGFILSYLLVFVINYHSFGWTFLYGVNWQMLLASMPLIVLAAVLAAVPAMRVIFNQPPALILRER